MLWLITTKPRSEARGEGDVGDVVRKTLLVYQMRYRNA